MRFRKLPKEGYGVEIGPMENKFRRLDR
jgi:hypothetical protein